MNVNEAVKIVEAIPDHEYICVDENIENLSVIDRTIQLDGNFYIDDLKALALVMEYKPEHWE